MSNEKNTSENQQGHAPLAGVVLSPGLEYPDTPGKWRMEEYYHVKSEYKNASLHNVAEKAIVVYGKSNDKLVYFRIFDYPNEEFEAKVQFDRLMNDLSIGEYRMMTIDRFSEVIEEGCRVVD